MSKNHNEDPRPFVIVRFVEGVKQYFASNDNEDGFWGTDIRFADRWHEDQARDVANGVGESAHPLRVKAHDHRECHAVHKTIATEKASTLSTIGMLCNRSGGELVDTAVRRVVAERDSLAVQLRHSKTQHSAENERAEKAIERLAFEVKRVDEAEAKFAAAEKERDALKADRDQNRAWVSELCERAKNLEAEIDALKVKLAAAEKERDALEARMPVLGDGLLAAKEDARQLCECLGNRNTELADAIRERDAAITEGDRQRERAKKAERGLAGADSTLVAAQGAPDSMAGFAKTQRLRAEKAEARLVQIAKLASGGAGLE